MAELTINGKTVTVDDSFHDLSPDQKESTVNEIASQMGMSTVAEDEKPEDSWRGEVAAGLRGVRKSLPFGQDIGAAAEAFRKGTSFEEEKRAQEARDKALAEQYPVATTAGEIGGFFVPGFGMAGPMAKAEQAVASRLAPKVGETAARIAGAGAAGAGAGAIQGLGKGVTPEERLTGAVEAAEVGGIGGAAFPALTKAAKGAAELPARVFGYSKPLTETEKAAAISGVELPWYMTAESEVPRKAAEWIRAVPFAGEGVGKATEKALGQLESFAGSLGAGTKPGEAGETAKNAISNWITDESKKKVNAAYNVVSKLVDPMKTAPLPSTAMEAQRIMDKLGSARQNEYSPAINKVLDAITDPKGLTFDGIKYLRTLVGEDIQKGILTGDVSQQQLNDLYRGLSTDLQNAASITGSPAAQHAFKRANQLYAATSNRRENLAKIIGAEGAKSESDVFNKIYRMATEKSGNKQLLLQARKTMPPSEWSEVSSGILSEMGKGRGNEFSPDAFVTSYYKLSEPGKDALFGPRGNTLRDSFENLFLMSKDVKRSGQEINRSRTAHVAAGVAMLAAPFTTMKAIPPALIMGKILANPRTAKAAANYAKSRTRLAYDAYLNAVRAEILGQSMEKERENRASGGRLGKRDYPAKKLTLMEKAARKAFNDIALESRPLMDMPDEAIVEALDMAKNK